MSQTLGVEGWEARKKTEFVFGVDGEHTRKRLGYVGRRELMKAMGMGGREWRGINGNTMASLVVTCV